MSEVPLNGTEEKQADKKMPDKDFAKWLYGGAGGASGLTAVVALYKGFIELYDKTGPQGVAVVTLVLVLLVACALAVAQYYRIETSRDKLLKDLREEGHEKDRVYSENMFHIRNSIEESRKSQEVIASGVASLIENFNKHSASIETEMTKKRSCSPKPKD